MSIFAHPDAIVASERKKTECTNCHHLQLIIADLQAWVEELRESRDHWRELALDAGRLAERTAAKAA